MTSKAPQKDHPEISAANFPALRSFLRGYFHEDVADEYGTLEEAAAQFYEDADPDERKAVWSEWSRFLTSTKSLSVTAINKLLNEKLGAACRLQADDVEKISRALQGIRPASEESSEEDEDY
jgi:CdiI immunity protein